MSLAAAIVLRFKRGRWGAALVACVFTALGILGVSELGHRELARGYQRSVQAIWLGARLHELSARLAEAETGQRSYLLTWDETYLEPYRRAVPRIRGLLDQLRPHYTARSDAEADRVFAALVSAISAKLGEIEFTLQLTERSRADRALEVIESGEGRRAMDEIRFLLEDLAAREETLVNEATGSWSRTLDLSRAGVAVAIGLNVFLVAVLLGAMQRDRRRSHDRQNLLNRLVNKRTRQLDTLARRLQEASEAEKAAMARELHDEFGALLTASKMDLAWIAKQLQPEQSSLANRLAAVMDMLDQGLLAKRRIVEGLRPSVLSHFGFAVAARELAEHYAQRAGWCLSLSLPQVGPALPDDADIVLYRILQESLTNAAKYSCARNVGVELVDDPEGFVLNVSDDGVGFDPRSVRIEAQGIFGMRHRVEARNGRFQIESRPGEGTRLSVTIPASNAVAVAADREGAMGGPEFKLAGLTA